MTRLLASVRNLHEARIALAHGADIIDLKEPALGALGAVPHEVACEVVKLVAGRVPVSATIGDVPLRAALIAPAVAAMARSGVDYVKIGLFSDQSVRDSAQAQPSSALKSALVEARARASGAKLVAVMFADRAPDCAVIDIVCEAGFAGVMLDTVDKSRGGLRSHMTPEQLANFLARAKSRALLTGLAGSLRLEDVEALAPLQPDYLGFRGALCGASGRAGSLVPARVEQVRASLSRVVALARVA